ncbi:MAG TPA: M48 family metallopeptidase [Noviherbaspirillum sp.]|nr:M48 family metallopeptidase [Noviherbaspirillum sp.]
MTQSTSISSIRQLTARFVIASGALILSACATLPSSVTSSPASAAPAPSTARGPGPASAPAAIAERTAPAAPVVPDPAATATIPAAPPEQTEIAVETPASPPPFDKAAALRTWVEQQDRLYRVVAPLLVKNTELCPGHARNLLGFTAKTKYSYSDDFIDVAQEVLGLDERLKVMSVLPGSGAAQAGVQPRDILLVAGIEPLPEGRDAERNAAALIASEVQGSTQLNLTVLRNDERIALDIPLTPACAMVVDLGNTDGVSSYADGHRLMITRGMLAFARTDEELAYALAREIAHNVLTAAPRADMGAVIDGLRTLDARTASPPLLGGITPFTPVLDATVDKLALYLLVRAGYEIDNVPGFWKRLAAEHPAQVPNSHTALHPSTAYRLSVIAQVTKAIGMKRKHRLPLVP